MAKATVIPIKAEPTEASPGYPEKWGVTNDGEYMEGYGPSED